MTSLSRAQWADSFFFRSNGHITECPTGLVLLTPEECTDEEKYATGAAFGAGLNSILHRDSPHSLPQSSGIAFRVEISSISRMTVELS